MARDNREPRRQAIDPLMDACLEGVAAGYRGVGYVAEGITESIRRRPGSGHSGGGHKGGGGQQRGGRSPGTATFVGEIAALTADLLDRLSETAEEIAAELGTRHEHGAERTLELKGLPGETPSVTFKLHNTGPAALTAVDFEATDLIGAAGRIDARAVDVNSEDGQKIDRIRSGGFVVLCVEVTIPDDQPAGTYRGVITTSAATRRGQTKVKTAPRDAWAVIELEVEATDPGRKENSKGRVKDRHEGQGNDRYYEEPEETGFRDPRARS